MNKEDTILKFDSFCNKEEQAACSSLLSDMEVAKEDEDGKMYYTGQKVCDTSVPVACPKITCYDEDAKRFMSCRRSHFAEGVHFDGSYWVRLPCKTCKEKKLLSDETERYVFEDGKRKS